MTVKRKLLLALLILFLAGAAFALNAFNERNLLNQQYQQLNQQLRRILNFEQIKVVTPPQLQTFWQVDESKQSDEVQPSLTPTPTRVPKPVDPYANDPDLKDVPWGQAVQVSETGWRMKVGMDERMGTPQETFQALNHYRYTKGKSQLTWDDRLARYALERATFICQNGSDEHAGFNRYVNEEEGYKTLGFYWLGENMSTHFRLEGVKLIEWMYAADPDHDGNQLGDWSHVGVGIFDDCSALIFGNKMI